MLKKSISFMVISFLLCTAASATYTVDQPDPGGSVSTFIQKWQEVAASGEKVVIDAPCMSACTFFLGLVPLDRVCVTPRASLGLHQMSAGDAPDPVMSAAFYRWLYPVWAQQWIKDHGGLKADVIFMYPEDLKGHIKLCPGYEYDPVSPDELINHGKE